MQQIDGYCERLGPGVWAEPWNAVTNGAFLLAAVWMGRRAAGVGMARVLAIILGVIAVGSFLFHTQATVWAAVADTAPIAVFVLVYLFAVNRDVLGLRWPVALLVTAGFLPFAALVGWAVGAIPVVGVSGVYWTVPVMLLLYAGGLRGRLRLVARGFVIGALILTVSIVFRSLDMILCPVWPLGTHFAWHLLNAVMLAWMIEVYLRHRLATARAGR